MMALGCGWLLCRPWPAGLGVLAGKQEELTRIKEGTPLITTVVSLLYARTHAVFCILLRHSGGIPFSTICIVRSKTFFFVGSKVSKIKVEVLHHPAVTIGKAADNVGFIIAVIREHEGAGTDFS